MVRATPPLRRAGGHRAAAALFLGVVIAAHSLGSSFGATCEAPAVTLRQWWSDLRLDLDWGAEDAELAGESVWLLLRTGSTLGLHTSVPSASFAFPAWPFDRALRLDLAGANGSTGACDACVGTVFAFEGAWVEREVPAQPPSTRVASLPTLTVLVDDNVLGLPRNASIAWCAVRGNCSECASTGMLPFDASLRWKDGAVAIAGSNRHFCAVMETGEAKCWGWNLWGQLGVGHTRSIGDDEFWRDQPSVRLGAGAIVLQLSCGWAHTCAVTQAGQLHCWGANEAGQLGLGNTTPLGHEPNGAFELASRVPLPSGSFALQVAAGGNHTCLVTHTSALWCWGENNWGQLGLGTTGRATSPQSVPIGATVALVAAGESHTCVVRRSDGGLQCWGRNEAGQLGLGHGNAVGDDEPVDPASRIPFGGLPFEHVACGRSHTCATARNGSLFCWGASTAGQLGLARTTRLGDDEPVAPRALVDLGGRRSLGAAAGPEHTCALVDGGDWLRCWGSDTKFQLGFGRMDVIGDDETASAARSIETGGALLAVATGRASTCILRSWGSIMCWGSGPDGEVGAMEPTRSRPLVMSPTVLEATVSKNVAAFHSLRVKAPFSGVRSVDVGVMHACLATFEGTVYCWGQNELGQLGTGEGARHCVPKASLVTNETPINGTAAALTSGWFHTCAVRADSQVVCWGSNSRGELGYGRRFAGDELGTDFPWNVGMGTVALGGTVAQLALGKWFSCVLLQASAAVRCWGDSSVGKLGVTPVSMNGQQYTPVENPTVQLGGPAVAIACGEMHACAVRDNGSVYCWGLNIVGQVGIETSEPVLFPILDSPVFALENLTAVSVSAGASFSCALLSTGSVRCWGNVVGGIAGVGVPVPNPTFDASRIPAVRLRRPAVQLRSGQGHSCARLDDGTVQCWGSNYMGQLGSGSNADAGSGVAVDSPEALPVALGPGASARMVASGDKFSCALLTTGAVRCWGVNELGQLGLGHQRTIGDDELPSSEATVSLGLVARYLAVGRKHACAALVDGGLRCWGANDAGQLGIGSAGPPVGDDELPSAAVRTLPDSYGVDKVTCGLLHTCVVFIGGVVKCWGANGFGQLGANSVVPQATATAAIPASIGGPALNISAGVNFTCVILMGGGVRCWGDNLNGRLGLATLPSSAKVGDDEEPASTALVSLGGFAVSISCGEKHACVALADGVVRCWGEGDFGQTASDLRLGLTTLPSFSQVDLPGFAVEVACGQSHSCARYVTGVVQCWGRNSVSGNFASGQLGNGIPDMRTGINTPPTTGGPVPEPPEGPFTQIAPGGDSHTCAVVTGGVVRCWGWNIEGQLGMGSQIFVGNTQAPAVAPTIVGMGGVIEIVTAGSLSCARNSTSLACWGDNTNGALGISEDVTTKNTPTPLDPVGLAVSAHIRSTDAVHWVPVRSNRGVTLSSWNSSSAPVRVLLGPEASAGFRIPFANANVHPDSLFDAKACPFKDATVLEGLAICATLGNATWLLEDDPAESASVDSADARYELGLLRPLGPTRVDVQFTSPWILSEEAPTVTIGPYLCVPDEIVSLRRLTCDAPGGMGVDLPLAVTTQSLLLPASLPSAVRLSFRPPVMQRVSPSINLSPYGNQSVIIDGLDFGAAHPANELVVGGVPCTPTEWSDSQVVCRTMPTTRAVSVANLTVGGQSSWIDVSFDLPRIIGVEPTVAVPSNDSLFRQSFMISGSSFGAEVGRTMEVEVGGVPCVSALLRASNLIECHDLLVPLSWPSKSVTISFGVVSARQDGLLRILNLPRVDAVVAPSFPTAGVEGAQIRGDGLGARSEDLLFVSVGDAIVPVGPDLVWESEFSLRVNLPAGVGAGIPVQVGLVHNVLSSQTSSSSFSYDRPVLSSVDPPYTLAGDRNITFTVCGTNLGSSGQAVHWVRLGGVEFTDVRRFVTDTCFELFVDAAPMNWSRTEFDRAGVSVGGQDSALVQGVFEGVDPPSITAVVAPTRPTAGGAPASILGKSFGVDREDVRSVRVGSALVPVEAISFVSRVQLDFVLPPGVGVNQPVVVTSRAGFESNAFSLSYDKPTISGILPEYALTGPAPQSFLVQGTNFGWAATQYTQVSVGGFPCGRVRALNESALACEDVVANADAWPMADRVLVEVAGQSTSWVRGVISTQDRPFVSAILPAEVGQGDVVTITGGNFGRVPEDVTSVMVGARSCASFRWQSAERLTCTIPMDHPMFLEENKPSNASDPSTWLAVTVTTRTGALSVENPDRDADGVIRTLPRVAPTSWSVGMVPHDVPVRVEGSREVGRFETIRVSWAVEDPTTEDDTSAALRVTGFDVVGLAPNGRLFRTTVAVASALTAVRGVVREYEADLSVSTRLPVTIQVGAVNRFGTGPLSAPSAPVLENCDGDQFLASHLNESQWLCLACPLEAVCGGLRAENITARQGFWRVPWSAYGHGFATCRSQLACQGWDNEEQLASNESTVSPSANASETVTSRWVAVPGLVLVMDEVEGCALGYEGVLCATCSSGYFPAAGSVCEPCGSATVVILRIVGIVLLGVVLLGVMLVRAYKSAGDTASSTIRILKIVFNHFQTIAIISSIRFQWPPSVADTFAVSNSASSFGVEGVSLECVMGSAGYDPLGRTLVTVSTPLWLLLYAAVFWAGAIGLEGIRRRITGRSSSPSNQGDHGEAPRFAKQAPSAKPAATPESAVARWVRRMKVSVPVLVFLVHTNVTSAVFRTVTCENLAPNDDPSNTQLRLSMDLNTRCDDPSALAWMIGVSVPILALFSLGVPLVTSIFLQRHRNALQEPENRRLFGFLFAGFRPGFEGWEGVTMLRKVLLAGVTVVLGPSGSFNQVGAALLVVVSFGFLHAWIRPFSDPGFNRLEMASLVAATVTMIAGLFIEGSGAAAVEMYVAPTGIFVVNLGFLLLALKHLLGSAGRSAAAGKGVVEATTAPIARKEVAEGDSRSKDDLLKAFGSRNPMFKLGGKRRSGRAVTNKTADGDGAEIERVRVQAVRVDR